MGFLLTRFPAVDVGSLWAKHRNPPDFAIPVASKATSNALRAYISPSLRSRPAGASSSYDVKLQPFAHVLLWPVGLLVLLDHREPLPSHDEVGQPDLGFGAPVHVPPRAAGACRLRELDAGTREREGCYTARFSYRARRKTGLEAHFVQL